MPPNSFSKLLLAAVDEGLSSLGDSSKQAIFHHLESSFNMRRECIPTNLTEFSKALEGIFGPGASHVERLIAKRLHDKLGIESEDDERLDFAEYVNSMKRRVLITKGACVF